MSHGAKEMYFQNVSETTTMVSPVEPCLHIHGIAELWCIGIIELHFFVNKM